jgi:hypothetical protein
MLKRALAAMVCAAMLATGCASAGGRRVAQGPAPARDTALIGDYVQRLAAGSRVRVERTDGGSLRGTLLKSSADAIVVQRDARIPEPPVEIPIAALARVTIDTSGGTSTGKAIAIGVASGVGTFFGILAILAAAWND